MPRKISGKQRQRMVRTVKLNPLTSFGAGQGIKIYNMILQKNVSLCIVQWFTRGFCMGEFCQKEFFLHIPLRHAKLHLEKAVSFWNKVLLTDKIKTEWIGCNKAQSTFWIENTVLQHLLPTVRFGGSSCTGCVVSACTSKVIEVEGCRDSSQILAKENVHKSVTNL